MTAPLLEVQKLVIEFDTGRGRRRVVDEVSFTLARGEVLGILGESGSGKTMTTMAVLGLVDGRPGVMSGEITLYDGETPIRLLHDLPEVLHPRGGRLVKNDRKWQRRIHQRMKPLWGRMMTAVFQNPRHSLDPLMTVGRQVEESIALALPDLDAAGRRSTAIDWLDRVQMTTLTLPPRTSQPALYSMGAVALEALRCNGRPPAAAALYFYQHNQRPQFRCLLRGYDLQAMGMHPDCPQVNPLAPSGPPK